jgi:hypothetical protein
MNQNTYIIHSLAYGNEQPTVKTIKCKPQGTGSILSVPNNLEGKESYEEKAVSLILRCLGKIPMSRRSSVIV